MTISTLPFAFYFISLMRSQRYRWEWKHTLGDQNIIVVLCSSSSVRVENLIRSNQIIYELKLIYCTIADGYNLMVMTTQPCTKYFSTVTKSLTIVDYWRKALQLHQTDVEGYSPIDLFKTYQHNGRKRRRSNGEERKLRFFKAVNNC